MKYIVAYHQQYDMGVVRENEVPPKFRFMIIMCPIKLARKWCVFRQTISVADHYSHWVAENYTTRLVDQPLNSSEPNDTATSMSSMFYELYVCVCIIYIYM